MSSLKKICKQLGWDRMRRWSHLVEAVKQIELENENLRHERSELSAIDLGPFFRQLVGNWTPNVSVVHQALASMEVRSTQAVLDAAMRSPIGRSRFGCMQGVTEVDSIQKLTRLDVAAAIIKDSPVERIQYVAEFMDCDDIAKIFWAICLLFYGVNVRLVYSFSSRHAFIAWPLLVDGSVEWRFLEPQTDGWKTDVHIGEGIGVSGDVSQALII